MQDLKCKTIEEMEKILVDIGEKKFRGKQIFKWISQGAQNFSEMTNIPKSLREKLKQSGLGISNLKVLKVQKSKSDGTMKFLFGLSDEFNGKSNEHDERSDKFDEKASVSDEKSVRFKESSDESEGIRGANKDKQEKNSSAPLAIESVLMKYKYGNSICISSQAGCRMGCRFCASTIGGLKRNLTAGEILDQIITVERITGEKITRIVVMGTGEPFDNYENLCGFIRLVHSSEGLNIGLRNITVSTCGIIPNIRRFSEDFPQVNLALSLHASNDNDRNKIMPVNRKYPMGDLLKAAKEYTKTTGRRVTFEYTLVKGHNDNEKNADELVALLKGMLCHVNLIPLNEVSETGLLGSSRKSAETFMKRLESKGIPATVRRELGSDIDAACGQLRLKNS